MKKVFFSFVAVTQHCITDVCIAVCHWLLLKMTYFLQLCPCDLNALLYYMNLFIQQLFPSSFFSFSVSQDSYQIGRPPHIAGAK